MKRVVVIGAGARGREVAEILRQPSEQGNVTEVLGFVDDNLALRNQVIDGLPILGDWSWLQGIDRSEVAVICASGFSETRKILFERARASGFSFANAISHVAYLSPHSQIGEGVVIYQHAIASRGTVIEDHVIINLGSIVSHDTKVGRYGTVNPGVNLAGNVTIGEGCYLGIGSSVIQGISIGSWTTVGAALITDLPDNVTAVGMPARVIKRRGKDWHEQATGTAE